MKRYVGLVIVVAVLAGGASLIAGWWSSERASAVAAPTSDEAQAAYKHAMDLLWQAGIGLGSWKETEDAFQAVIKLDPDNAMAREYLGRIYTRQRRYQEALPLLSPGATSWSELHRAFCLDALGKRAEAVAIYENLVNWPAETSIGAWGHLGGQEPVWLRDLDIHAEPGEARIMPGGGWRASAWDAKPPTIPEFAIDANPATTWYTGGDGHGQTPGEWFELDFDVPQLVSRLVFDHQGTGTFFTNDWPRGLLAAVTADGKTWRGVAVSQPGPLRPAEIRFDAPQKVRGVKLTLTAMNDPEYWRIHEIYVFGPKQ